MKVSLSGLLGKAAKCCDVSCSGGEGFAVRELLTNLKELRDRKAEGQAVIDEFFQLYTIEETANAKK